MPSSTSPEPIGTTFPWSSRFTSAARPPSRFAETTRRAISLRTSGIALVEAHSAARFRSVGTIGSMPYQIIRGSIASWESSVWPIRPSPMATRRSSETR